MTTLPFETALGARVDEMLDACTRCGKCVEACPSVPPAGLAAANPVDVIGGVIDIVRSGDGPAASPTLASSCMLSRGFIKACPHRVNPRLLLATARIPMAKPA